MLELTVYGTPGPQGSKRHVGRGIMIESSKLVKPWRDAVKATALQALGPAFRPLNGPVGIEITFTVKKPQSAPKRRVTWPTKRPDVDKLVRSTLDAISDAGIWIDDSQVVELISRKVFPEEGIDALRAPGALIRITDLTPVVTA